MKDAILTIGLALGLALASQPAQAQESKNHTGLVLAGYDTAVILPSGLPLQVEYLGDYVRWQAGLVDCLYFEDASLYCE